MIAKPKYNGVSRWFADLVFFLPGTLFALASGRCFAGDLHATISTIARLSPVIARPEIFVAALALNWSHGNLLKAFRVTSF